MKEYAEINGRMWEAAYPLCAGCVELVISGGCSYKGNGCKYPESRIKRPASIRHAFFALARSFGKSVETICDELGSCINLEPERMNEK